jgi:inner membrane protein
MANGTTHLIVGGLAGLGISLWDKSDDSEFANNPLLATTVGAMFGKLPDILEPALHPHHRQFCHSIVVLLGVGYGMKKAYQWEPKDNVDKLLRCIALCVGAGYISHLLLDATTPRSLPILGKI